MCEKAWVGRRGHHTMDGRGSRPSSACLCKMCALGLRQTQQQPLLVFKILTLVCAFKSLLVCRKNTLILSHEMSTLTVTVSVLFCGLASIHRLANTMPAGPCFLSGEPSSPESQINVSVRRLSAQLCKLVTDVIAFALCPGRKHACGWGFRCLRMKHITPDFG